MILSHKKFISNDPFQIVMGNKIFSNGKIYEISFRKNNKNSDFISTYLSDQIKNASSSISYSSNNDMNIKSICNQKDNCNNWNIDYNFKFQR